MENNKTFRFKNFKLLMAILIVLLLISGTSYALYNNLFVGNLNSISANGLKLEFLESNDEIINIPNAVPIPDSDGIAQDVYFDFAVTSEAGFTKNINYSLILEKLQPDSGYTLLSDSDIKIYLTDLETGEVLLGPALVSSISSDYVLHSDTHVHSSSNAVVSDKYRLKVWVDDNASGSAWNDPNARIAYKFKIGIITDDAPEGAEKHILTFNTNGGSGGQNSSLMAVNNENMPGILTTKPTKSGYTFMGWYDNQDYTRGTKYYTYSGESARNFDKTSNTTLYAGWETVANTTFSLSFNVNGGSGGQSSSLSVIYGSELPSISTVSPTREGYTFMGWYDNQNYTQGTKYYDDNGNSVTSFDAMSNKTLYAGWLDSIIPSCSITSTNNVATAQTVTLSCADDGSKVKYYYFGTSSSPTTGNFTTITTATTNFSTTNSISAPGTYYLIAKDSDGNVSTAVSKTFYKTTFIMTDGSVSPASVITMKDNSFTLPTPTADTDYETSGYWYTNSGCTEGAKAYGTSYTPGGNATLYSNAILVAHRVQLVVNNGSGSTTKRVDLGESTTFTIGANTGYSNPTISCTNGQTATISGTTVTTAVITSNTVCTVTYVGNKYNVSFNSNNGTGGQSSTVQATYGSNMPAISTTAPTRDGYTFMGWYDNSTYTSGTQYYTAAGASARTYNKTSNATLYAGWQINNYSVTFNANGGSGGQSAAVNANYGNAMPTISTTAPTKTGYTFMGWYDNATYTSGTQYYTAAGASAKNFDKTSSLALYAGWADQIKPVCSITSTNNVAASQTATLSCTDEGSKVKYYYFGTSSSPATGDFTTITTATANFSTTNSISAAGTYYLIAKDSDGNVSTSVSKTFYKTTLTMSNGSVSPTSVITMSGNSFTLPIPTANTGYTVKGSWYTDSGLTTGTKAYGTSYSPSANATLYSGATINSYTVQLVVNNGTGSTSKSVNYNSSTTFTIAANSGYENPSVSCTNGQTATISGTTVTTGNISNNTVCTVNYRRINLVTINYNDFTSELVSGTQSFSYSANVQQYVVPGDGEYTLTVKGASGGNSVGGVLGGAGGTSTGTVTLAKDETLYVHTGGQGTAGTSANGIKTGGANGGGASGYVGAGSGGGATDIRIGTDSNAYRVIVAGGGGGAGNGTGYTGGAGGGTTGGDASAATTDVAAKGGTQTAGGAGGAANTAGSAGTFGQGGAAASNTDQYNYSGGGGGGWYGGGGGGYRSHQKQYTNAISAGGGGSGFIYTDTNSACSLNSKYMLSNASMTSGNNTGNGSATIDFSYDLITDDYKTTDKQTSDLFTTFNITPADSNNNGAIVTCNNGATGEFYNNVLTIDNLSNDTTCDMEFIKGYTVSVAVVNGVINGSAAKTINKNTTTTFSLTPANGYGNGQVSCTNGQTASLNGAGTLLTTGAITSNTTCTVMYSAS